MLQNTTLDARSGWVSSGDGRSTSDILWSCFSVFLVCTWSCLHLNVPSIEESEAGWYDWHGIPYWPELPLLEKWIRKILWMGAIVLAPEVGVAMAMRDFLSARESFAKAAVQNADETGEDERAKMTKSHAFLANMGADAGENMERPASNTNFDIPAPTLVEGILMNYDALAYIREICQDCHIPDEEDIKALSKRDPFTKLFAIVQSTWLVVQCIARASVGLPITQLELATIAFVFCGLVMYGLWWNKPYGVERRELVVGTTNVNPSCMHGSVVLLPNQIYHYPYNQVSHQDFRTTRTEQPPFFAYIDLSTNDLSLKMAAAALAYLRGSKPKSLGTEIGSQIAFYLAGTLFSALHILAWNWEFPNTDIKIAWRVFAVTATTAYLGGGLFLFVTLFQELGFLF
ncbi:uncharacterized protein LY89DRAFT_730707 [Mollisia scopiformis]|uniref:Uncharacterized protein n=1 Tax=Mollisia scopiformis TaxID=149040 RepID=A0A194XKR6_MOLSC|nr:uncharacterized protein LY89DRAFT_730707 [Mollisia scopiformis]KUJ20689.1 hypothetical protein LY89DRAFT_730707 [Mollisia scopiformis]